MVPAEILLFAIFVPLTILAVWISHKYVLTPELFAQDRALEAAQTASSVHEEL